MKIRPRAGAALGLVIAGLSLLALFACGPAPKESSQPARLPHEGQVAGSDQSQAQPSASEEAPGDPRGKGLQALGPQAKDSRGDLHVAVPAGTVVRSGPESSAEAIDLIAEDGLFAVQEKVGAAYRIELEVEEAARAEPVDGWVRSSSKPFKEVRIHRGRRGPQPAPEPPAELLVTAKRHLQKGGRELSCGPYRLLTDVPGEVLPKACRRVATRLDPFYEESFGVRPVGPPEGAIILFRDLRDFRAFAGEATGHAGHAHASEGYLSLYLGERSHAELITTLAHELSHLVHRRALGSPLPRWLSEGLADAIGDPATLEGLGRVSGLKGAETARRRVLERSDLPNVEALTGRGPGEFDAGPTARDYEESAVLVRYLLSDPERRRVFQNFLKGVAAGESAELPALVRHLGLSPDEGPSELDRRLRQWLEETR